MRKNDKIIFYVKKIRIMNVFRPEKNVKKNNEYEL